MNNPDQNQNTTPNKGHPQQEQGKPFKDPLPGSDTDPAKQADSTPSDRPADEQKAQKS